MIKKRSKEKQHLKLWLKVHWLEPIAARILSTLSNIQDIYPRPRSHNRTTAPLPNLIQQLGGSLPNFCGAAAALH